MWAWNKACLLWVRRGCQECHPTGSMPAPLGPALGNVEEHQWKQKINQAQGSHASTVASPLPAPFTASPLLHGYLNNLLH